MRIVLLLPGLFLEFWELAKKGSRDIWNRIKFRGSSVDRGCCFTNDSKLGMHSTVMKDTYVNHSSIGNYTYVGMNCMVQNASIGNYCSIANNVVIGPGRHPMDRFSTSPVFYNCANPTGICVMDDDSEAFSDYKPVMIGNDVWVGVGAIILDGVSVGDGAVIAAGAVVNRNVRAYEVVGGVPAKVISNHDSGIDPERLTRSEWWNHDPLVALDIVRGLKKSIERKEL